MHIDFVIMMPMWNVKMVMVIQPPDDGHSRGNKASDRSSNGDDGYVAGQYAWSR